MEEDSGVLHPRAAFSSSSLIESCHHATGTKSPLAQMFYLPSPVGTHKRCRVKTLATVTFKKTELAVLIGPEWSLAQRALLTHLSPWLSLSPAAWKLRVQLAWQLCHVGHNMHSAQTHCQPHK